MIDTIANFSLKKVGTTFFLRELFEKNQKMACLKYELERIRYLFLLLQNYYSIPSNQKSVYKNVFKNTL